MKKTSERVADRWLAASSLPSSPALKLLQMMAGGGGKASVLNLNILEEALSAIGWTVSIGVGSAPLTESDQIEFLLSAFVKETGSDGVWGWSGAKEPKHFWYTTTEAAEFAQKRLRAYLGKGPAVVGEARLREILPDFEIKKDWGGPGRHRISVVTLGWSLGVPSYRFSPPRGQSLEATLPVDSRGTIADPGSVKLAKFWTWAYKNGLKEDASEYLGSLGAEDLQRKTSPQSMRSLENTGTCPCCFRNIKLSGKTMIRHGWQVQGKSRHDYVWHTGPCFGFGHLPFEQSKEGTQEYLRYLNDSLSALERQSRNPPRTITVRKVTYSEGDPTWDQVLKSWMVSHEREVKSLRETIRDLEAKIASWSPRPLPGA